MTQKASGREATKPSTLRLVVPKIIAQRVINSLGPEAKVEAIELDLKTERLTIENVVRYVKEFTKVRDELVLTFRQLGMERDGKPLLPKLSNLDATLQEARKKTQDAQEEYKRILLETESFEREAQEAAKQLATVEQISTTGFNYDELASRITGFRRILGKLPAKKVEAAQKALGAFFKDRAVMTTGARRNDWVYLLVASPTDAASQALQTLLLYDFVPTDMPSFDGPDLKEAMRTWEQKRDKLTREVEGGKQRMTDFRREQSGPLNNLADQVEETILVLRSSLRLGQETKAAHIYARLEKPISTETLNALARDGILELD